MRAHYADYIGQKRGHPPGSLVHIGERVMDQPKITVIEYDETAYSCREIADCTECRVFPDRETVTWINIDGVHEAKLVDELGRSFGLHPLLLEDIMNTGQRPKLEEYDDCIFIVLKMLDVDGEADQIMVEQVSLIIGKTFVITFQERAGDVFDGVRDRIKRSLGKIRKSGADYLAYRLIDAIVDNYFVALDTMGDLLEEMEDRITESPGAVEGRELHVLKREMLYLRKAIHPARELLGSLSRIEDRDLVREPTLVYLRDVYDHSVQVAETLEVQRDILASMLDVFHSATANRMNEIMKVLSIVSTIFMPLTFIAGIYGMNFEYMPELKVPWAYPAVLALMVGAGAAMLVWFRYKRWL